MAYPARARPLEGGEGCRFPRLDHARSSTRRQRGRATRALRNVHDGVRERGASTAANATVEVSNATSTSGDLGDPLLSLARDPSLPVSCARVRAASRELADAGLATLAATALETYGGAAEVRRGDPTRPTPRYRNTHHSPSPPPPTPQAARHLAAARRGDHRVRFRAGYVGRRRRPTRIRARSPAPSSRDPPARRRGPSPPEDGLCASRGTRRSSSRGSRRNTTRVSHERRASHPTICRLSPTISANRTSSSDVSSTRKLATRPSRFRVSAGRGT